MDDPRERDSAAVSVCCHDPDEARAVGRDVYHPHALSVSRSVTPFEMRLQAADLGPVTAGVLGYRDEVRIETDPFETSYQVNVPLHGQLDCWEGRRRVVADRDTAVVFGPEAPTGFTGFAGGGQLVGIKIDTAAVEDATATLTGRRRPRPALPATLALDRGRGREWWSMARAVVDLLETPQGLIGDPLITRPLVRALVVGLLLALGVAEDDGGRAAVTPTVRRAMRIFEDGAGQPLTIADVAATVGTCARTLQAGFRRELGVTPMGYLRDVRLSRAHSDLLDADPGLVTVGEIARRWGFDHLGRFATAHRRRFGVLPSETLHADA